MAHQDDQADVRPPASPQGDEGSLSVDRELEALANALESELASSNKGLSTGAGATPTDEVEFVVEESGAHSGAEDAFDGAATIDIADSLTDAVAVISAAVEDSARRAGGPQDDVVDAALEQSLDALIAEAEAVIAVEAGTSAPGADAVQTVVDTMEEHDDIDDVVVVEDPLVDVAADVGRESDARSLVDVDESLAHGAAEAVSSVVDEAIAAAAREINLRMPGAAGHEPDDPLAAAAATVHEDFEHDLQDAMHDSGSEAPGASEADPFATSVDVVDDAIETHGVVVDNAADAGFVVDDGAADMADRVANGPTDASPEPEEADELAAAMSAAAMPTDTIEVASSEVGGSAPATTTTTPRPQAKTPAAAKDGPAARPSGQAAAVDSEPKLAKAAIHPKRAVVLVGHGKRATLSLGRALSYPMMFVPAAHRSTVGWISVNTLFLGVGVLIVSLMARGGRADGTSGAPNHQTMGAGLAPAGAAK